MGYFETPLECPPHAYWFGDGRYDDPLREFQTLYCAPDPLTCLREKLAPFRVSIRMRDELQRQGKPLSNRVTMKWRRENALAQGSLEILEGELVAMYQPGIRLRLERDLKDLLIDLGISFLDLGELQGSRRRLTQAIARTVFGWGAAGILYHSKLDGQLACALFGHRARLIPATEPKLLSEPLPELDQVCGELGLDVESAVPKSLV